MVSFRAVLAGLGLATVAQLPSCLAFPTTNLSLGYDLYDENALLKRQEDDNEKPFWLRIMPLGASITAGTNGPPGSDGNGYRKFLRDKLRLDGWQVNMVGTFQHGTMNDNDHEGVSGHVVSQVAARTKGACNVWRPNVVLINAGTNDATGGTDPIDQTGNRMRQVIDGVFSEVPNALVVLSTLLPHKNRQDDVNRINDQYRQLVRDYVPDPNEEDPAFKVILAEMADGFITLDDIHDDVHPTELGNKKMAAVWYHAINDTYARGWISEPSTSGEFSDDDTKEPTCRKKYGSGQDDPRAGRWVLGAADKRIKSDGQYKHAGTLSDIKGSFKGKHDARMWVAQLFNHGLPKLDAVAELVFVDGNYEDRKIMWRKNNGGGKLEEAREITSIKDGCLTRGIHWGDVNGDGLDDFICIARDGEMFVWINKASNGEDPTFENLGSYKKPEMGLGQEHVRLGDIDGDGRLDYCVITDAGHIHCWRNGGIGDKAAYWQDMGMGNPIFNPKGMGDIRGVRFADLNGDGRDDWVWISKEGQVTTWINQRGNSKSMIPYWQEAAWNPTHAGVGKDVGDMRERIQFGRFFGSKKCDYLHYDVESSGTTRTLNWRIWENTGEGGGKYQKGDGAYWGDMTNNGVDDYIWINWDGEVTIFRNKNSASHTNGYATGPWLPGVSFKTGKDRRGLHIGDWDGDGHADIIYAARDTGALTVWFTSWDGENFSFDRREIPNSDKCNLGWGLLYTDHAAHFADISGSGKVDYLCMGPQGRTTAWIRDKDTAWDDLGTDVGQVKFAEGWDRANLRFADVDGDKRADLIWTDKFNGDGWVWYNLGPGNPDELRGSAFEWEPRQKVYQGSSRGPNMHFPSLGGQGRADMVGINPTTGKGQAWFNSCPRGGDDGPLQDPGLPDYTPQPVEPPPPPETHWFCDVGDSSWDAGLWREHGIGRWLVQRTELYMGPDVDWPRPGVGDARDTDEGIPRIIGSYNGFTRDGLFTWEDGCRNIYSDGCNLDNDEVTDPEACPQHAERAFSLWAMRNLARFIQSWYDLYNDAALVAGLWNADIAAKFMWHSASTDVANAGSWLTIVAGALTGVGAFVPGLGSLASNGLAGFGTIAAGAAGFMSSTPPQDTRFDDFAELGASLGNYTTMVSEALGKYFNELIRDTPAPDASWEDATRLARLLEDGFWANMDAGSDVTADPEAKSRLVTQIRAAVIAEAWNSEHVGIVKWSDDSLFAEKFGFSPCFGEKNKYGMDHAIACLNEANYVITPMHWDGMSASEAATIKNWPKVGQDTDTLSEYDLTMEDVILAAERTQDIAHGYQIRDLESAVKLIEDSIATWDGDVDSVMAPLRFFNVPVCDLDYVTSMSLPGNCGVAGRYHDDYTKACALSMMSTGCSGLVLGGTSWPYGEGPPIRVPV